MDHPVRLTIDGRAVEVAKGTTLLEAAASIGIFIPTLCHLKGAKAITSCFVCLVQIDGRESLAPACGTEAHDGMRVSSQTPEVLGERRAALELLLSEHYGDCEGPCTLACPSDLDVPTMIEHLTANAPDKAVASAREHILFNAVLGRICPAFCERACRRAELDRSVSIAALQRATGDAGVASGATETCAAPTGKRVCVVGAGPAGLTAAYYVLRRGHAVTLVDSEREPGGAWRYGVPEFRLPRAALDGEIAVLRRMGAAFRMGVRVGTDVTLGEVKSSADALLVAVGASLVKPLSCPGAELARPGIDFLREVNSGARPTIGRDVVVIGAGSPGTDEARVALRLGASRVVLLRATPGSEGAKSFRRIQAAEAEGVKVLMGAPVHRIESLPGGRFIVMAEHDGHPVSFEADAVIASGEREPDPQLFARLGLAAAKRGLAADARTFATSMPGVFAAGECVRGADYGVRAVAMGRAAAACIDQFLRGEKITGEAKRVNSRMGRLTPEDLATIRSTSDPAARQANATVEPTRARQTFDEADAGLASSAASTECRRCLQCSCLAKEECSLRDHATALGASANRYRGAHRAFARDLSHPTVLYEAHKCILCGLCLRAAAEAGEKLGLSFVGRGFATVVAVPFGEKIVEGLKIAPERCVEVCPTGALAFKRRLGESQPPASAKASAGKASEG